MTTNESLATLERHLLFLNNHYLETSLFDDILTDNKSLESELDNFYGIYGGTVTKEITSKQNQSPDSLLEILNEFSPVHLDSSKLIYENVRRDHLIDNNPKSLRWSVPYECISLAATFYGFTLAFGVQFPDKKPLDIINGIAIGILGAGHLINSIYLQSRTSSKVSDSFKEYKKAVKAANNANSFIKNQYREYLYEKRLEKARK